MKTHFSTSIRFLKFFGLLLVFILVGAATGIQQTNAAEPPPQSTPTDMLNLEGGGSGLTPGEVQGYTVESALSGGVDTQDNPSYNGCVFVWDVWVEDNGVIEGTYEPFDWIYFYMYVANECYPYVNPNTLFWWQVWSPGNVSEISYQEYFTVYYGDDKWWLEAQFDANPTMGEWLYKGTTSYYGGTNSDTRTFKVVPKAPSGVSASDGTYTDKVRVTWSASSGATSYDVYRATSSGGTYSLIGSPASTSFDDTTATPGTTYYYEVRGCVSVGCGGYSGEDSGWRATGGGESGDNVGLYNPSNSDWFLKYSQTDGTADLNFAFGPGGEGWKPIIGDWNDNGSDTVGLYNPLTSKWYLRNVKASGAADVVVRFGPVGMGWIPITGDWNNNGNSTIGFYSPTTSKFYLRNSLTAGAADVTFRFGPAGYGWLPIAGDWDNDGVDEVGLYNPVTSKFYLRYTHTSGAANATFRFGVAGAGWLPIAGDWDDNGVDSAGLYKPANSKWYLRNAFTDGVADTTFSFGPSSSSWTPLVGNWD